MVPGQRADRIFLCVCALVTIFVVGQSSEGEAIEDMEVTDNVSPPVETHGRSSWKIDDLRNLFPGMIAVTGKCWSGDIVRLGVV
jgi:hypothetical protein